MTAEEAQKICAMMMTADMGCPYCASDLLKMFAKEFPDFLPIAEGVFRDEGYDGRLAEW